MGYRIAVLRQGVAFPEAEVTLATDHYLGWAASINQLAKHVMEIDNQVQWLVVANDDTDPDLCHPPDQIALECGRHFGSTFGVMQPTGDRWRDDSGEVCIEHYAGSPWLGREWCQRAYSGNGPICSVYHHCFADRELMLVAKELGVYWERQDLIHLHNHWRRTGQQIPWAAAIDQDYTEFIPVFWERLRAGWPGHVPLPGTRSTGRPSSSC